MNLPAVINIALGLIFIYLTLSLLTSEIQELIAILLQWRAEHLKKSIGNLLTGEWNNTFYRRFTEEFYADPLIRALNQEGRGSLELFWRKIVRGLANFYYRVTKTKPILGNKNSAPSYIPAETFSVALMQRLGLQPLSQKISELTARKIIQTKLGQLADILDDLRNSSGNPTALVKEFSNLQRTIDAISEEFFNGRMPLSACLEQITAQLSHFIDHTEALLSEHNYREDLIRRRLPYLRQLIDQPQLEPTLTEVLHAILEQQGEQKSDHQTSALAAMIQTLQKEHPEWLEQIADLPPQLKENLYGLAEQARLKATGLDNQVRQLEQEIAVWFNHSMERASGVYRRNAKGVGILIGCLTAIAINADTLHMVDRLSKDAVIRATISQAAEQIVLRTPATSQATSPTPATPTAPTATASSDLKQVKDAVNTVLDELPLPIGWSAANIQSPATEPFFWVWGKRLLGWLITGIALSMGASFWYDLLQNIMQVRGTGKKPDHDRSQN